RFMSWYISMISLSILKLSTIMFKMFEKCLIVFEKTVYMLNSRNTPFLFTEKASKEFEALKKAFTTAPILAHFSELSRTLIETNASEYADAGVISQYSYLNILHLVAFDSRKLHNSELNYEIHDKELIAIVFCLQKWCSYLLSLSETFEVLTDHNALKYFMRSKVPTRCQDQWAEFFSEFHFTITY
ncbi:uncharacterized protein VP01_10519g1, partial [Puccinia sorghi]